MHMYKMQPKTLGYMQNDTRWKMHKKIINRLLKGKTDIILKNHAKIFNIIHYYVQGWAESDIQVFVGIRDRDLIHLNNQLSDPIRSVATRIFDVPDIQTI